MSCAVISIVRTSDLSYELTTNSLVDNMIQVNLHTKAEAEITAGFIVKSKTDKLPSNEWVITFEKVPPVELVI